MAEWSSGACSWTFPQWLRVRFQLVVIFYFINVGLCYYFTYLHKPKIRAGSPGIPVDLARKVRSKMSFSLGLARTCSDSARTPSNNLSGASARSIVKKVRVESEQIRLESAQNPVEYVGECKDLVGTNHEMLRNMVMP
jgi:hypothetical protein